MLILIKVAFGLALVGFLVIAQPDDPQPADAGSRVLGEEVTVQHIMTGVRPIDTRRARVSWVNDDTHDSVGISVNCL